ANIFMLAWPYGTPILISSYEWENDRDAGRPVDRSQWVNEEFWDEIAPMIRFRRETQGEPANRWWSNGYQAIAFSRGNRGFLAMSKEDQPVNLDLETGLAPGLYINVAAGRP